MQVSTQFFHDGILYMFIILQISINQNIWIYWIMSSSYSPNASEEDAQDMYAAKFIRCNGAAARLRAREEIDILSSLQHQNILRYIFHKISLANILINIH